MKTPAESSNDTPTTRCDKAIFLARTLERELFTTKVEVERLNKLLAIFARGDNVTASEVFLANFEANGWKQEVERLKRGDFTPDEFQHLCHNRHEKEGCTEQEFFDGCALFQKSMFGKCERDEILARYQAK